jgi:DNA-binding MarR family transcriptional regulator
MHHPRPWHKHSIFGDGPRIALDREARHVWRTRIEARRRNGQLTDAHAQVALALLRRLGHDGRLDPSQKTIADAAAASLSTAKRALTRLRDLGLVFWVNRIARTSSWRVEQISNAYVLTLGAAVAHRGSA